MPIGDTLARMADAIVGLNLSPQEREEMRLWANRTQSANAQLSGILDAVGNVILPVRFEKVNADLDVLDADVASITVQIPSQYSHLIVIAGGRTDGPASADAIDIQLNGDTGANYHYGGIYNINTAVTAGEVLGASFLQFFDFSASTSNGNSSSGGFVFMPHIQSNLWKALYEVSGAENINGTNQYAQSGSGFWMSTDAITSITMFPEAGTVIKAGSQISVYGIA